MKEKESIMVVWCKLKIPSLGITVQHLSASLAMPNSNFCDGIINSHLTTIKDSYSVDWDKKLKQTKTPKKNKCIL